MEKKQTILLTGATGFLGCHLLEGLLNNNYPVIILVRTVSDTCRIAHLLDKVTCYNVDNKPLEEIFEEQRIDVIIHLASDYGRNASELYSVINNNIMFGIKLLDAAIKFAADAFVNTDTFFNTATYAQKHLAVYTLTKKHFVEWLRLSEDKVKIVNLKLHHVFGDKDRVTKFIPWVLSQYEKNEKEIPLTKGEQKKDFIHVDDVVCAYLTILLNLYKLPKFSEFQVGTGNVVSLKSFLRRIDKLYKKHDSRNKTKLCFGEVEYSEGEIMNVSSDVTPLLELGWSPKISLDVGVTRLLKS